ncbi:CIA30 family protein [Chlorobium sp. N1]|uniref:CIA30 family protein n=1 Tax=Chlorobium sp. N1 TaxID=2491138 RepID=UPI0010403B47|nr:CIA30 family protein [Chlorobium sp. N1]TCD48674.1 CIA30 family protein [Chlorobium sp. N1]
MQERMLCDFSSTRCLKWHSVDDGIMGGISVSRLSIADPGTAVFDGVLSTENGGGFASVRTFPEERDFSGFDGLRLFVRGDGRRYSFRIRNDDSYDGIVYRSDFEPVAGKWMEVDLPFSGFSASFRGRSIEGATPLDRSSIVQIGLLVSREEVGPFRLELRSIRAYRAVPEALRA